jgi:hypothetical protein
MVSRVTLDRRESRTETRMTEDGIMKQRKTRPARTSTDADSIDIPEYVATWAEELVEVAGKREARVALAEYRRLAVDKAVPKAERKAAAERAAAIEKRL